MMLHDAQRTVRRMVGAALLIASVALAAPSLLGVKAARDKQAPVPIFRDPITDIDQP